MAKVAFCPPNCIISLEAQNNPLQHMAFYREVVVRLIEAGELPSKAKSQFDRTFSAGFLKALANN